MPIIFDGEPPYDPLFARSAKSEPSLEGVVLTFVLDADAPPHSIAAVQLVLEPDIARALHATLETNARVTERWRKNQS